MTDEEFWDRLITVEKKTAWLYSVSHSGAEETALKLDLAMQVVKDYNEIVADYMAKPKLQQLREKMFAKQQEAAKIAAAQAQEERAVRLKKAKVVTADVEVHTPLTKKKNKPQHLRKNDG